MPRKKKEVVASTAMELVPEGQATVKATKRNLLRLQDNIHLENVEGMLRESYAALRQRIRRGDNRSIQMAFEISGMLKNGPGTTVQILNQNNNKAEAQATSTTKTSFASLIRRLEQRDASVAKAADFIEVSPD